MSLLPVGFGASGDDYEITDSLRLRSSASAYLARTPASDGNRQIFTFSAWAKRGALGAENVIFHAGTASANRGHLRFNSDDTCEWAYFNGSWILWLQTTAVFRDPSAWYHIVGRCNTTNGTSNLYINGVDQTSLSQNAKPSGSQSTSFGQAVEHQLGQRGFGDAGYLDGYVTEANFIDGQALTADDFGEYDANGTWKAKQYTGTYGTNGFYLPMKPTTQANGFNTVLYTGDSGTQSISGVGFSPDFVWIKPRNAVGSHILQDTVRGNTKFLESNSTGVEQTNSSTGLLSFDSDGFTVGSGNDWNNSGETFVAWAWDAGSGSAASNTDGSITSTVKANDSYGFSIVSYTGNGTSGATIGHGLSSAPKMIIVKNRTTAGADWPVYHEDTGNTGATYLNTTAAFATDSTRWNNTSPTSTVFSVGNGQGVNHSSASLIAYCFSEVAGYSKIGSFQNNNSTSGVTVTTGFRPSFIILKCTDAGERWFILDNARQVNNVSPPSTAWLVPNDNAAEGANGATTATIDFLDNGFQIKTTNPATGEVSFGTRTYIYMAIADTADARFNFDASGNKNNWLPNNINSNAESETTYDLMKDTPSLVDENAANFATLNPLTGVGATFARANMQVTHSAATSGSLASFALPKSNKWYWESTVTQVGSGSAVGILSFTDVYLLGSGAGYGQTSGSYTYRENGQKRNNSTGSTYGATYTTGDVIGIAYDADNDTLTFYKNGTSQGVAWSSLTEKPYFPVQGASVGTANIQDINFGQRPFAYTPPTGFLKLNTFNLPDSTIEKGSDYFNTVLYSGNSSTQSITGVGFQPDWLWLKSRSNSANHGLHDVLRVIGSAEAILYSNSTAAENTGGAYISSFDTDGFTLNGNTSGNGSGQTYVGWNWKANGSGVSNTDGSITSTVSANTTAGFSIVTYTGNGTAGATVGHGLGASLGLLITKPRSISGGWALASTGLGTTGDTVGGFPESFYIALNATGARSNNGGSVLALGDTTKFAIGNGLEMNQSSATYIAYCFAPIEGYSAFGSYTGNGSSDGPFVYTGFRPAFLIIKKATGSVNANAGWILKDATRDVDNVVSATLQAESAGAEYTSGSEDFLSNGFKIRTNNIGQNTSGSTYIYMAFAENPFKNANAR